MAFTKITENDTINKGVMGLPDTPNLSTSEMQAKFEELSNDVIIPKFNNLVDELEAKSAAGNTGATIPSGINAESENVQAVLNGIAEKAHTHEKSDAELTDAVTKAHEHSNKSVIDKFTENESGVPLYNGGKMTGDAFKKGKEGDKYITAKDYDTIEIVAGDNVVIDADTEKKTLKISAIGGSGGGGGDMYKSVYDKDNDGMVDNAKTVGSLDNLNTTNQENVVGAINEVIADRQIKTYLSPTLMDSTKNWTNYALKDLKAGRCLMASLSETTDISNAYTNGVIPVQKAGTLKGINVNNNGFYQYFTIDGEQYINSCSNFVANTFTGWNKFDVDTLTTLEQVTASTDVSKPVGAGAVQELNSSLPHIDTIWTRSNLLTTFTNQTIELLNLNTYDGIEIIWNGVITSGGNATQGTSTGFLPFSILTEENVYFSLRFVSSGSQIDVRDFSIDLVNNNITFTGSCGNNRCIPQKILGYKGFM